MIRIEIDTRKLNRGYHLSFSNKLIDMQYPKNIDYYLFVFRNEFRNQNQNNLINVPIPSSVLSSIGYFNYFLEYCHSLTTVLYKYIYIYFYNLKILNCTKRRYKAQLFFQHYDLYLYVELYAKVVFC